MVVSTRPSLLLLAAATLLVSALPLPALALETDGMMVQQQIEEGSEGFPLSGSITLENAVGLGSFVDNPDTDQMKTPYYALLLTLRGAYAVSESVAVRTRLDLEKEITSSYSTATTNRRQIMPSDLWIDVSHSSLLHDERWTGLKLQGDLRVYFPTSYESRYASRLLGLGARLAVARSFGDLSVLLGSRYLHYLLRYSHPVVVDYQEHTGQLPCTGLQVDGGMVCGGMANTRNALLHDLTLSYDITGSFSAAVALYVINRFSYGRSEPDELSSQYATGETQRDQTWGIVDLSYRLNRWVTYSLGVSSFQPVRTADGQRLRFPFWDTESQAENYTTFYMDVQGSF